MFNTQVVFYLFRHADNKYSVFIIQNLFIYLLCYVPQPGIISVFNVTAVYVLLFIFAIIHSYFVVNLSIYVVLFYTFYI